MSSQKPVLQKANTFPQLQIPNSPIEEYKPRESATPRPSRRSEKKKLTLMTEVEQNSDNAVKTYLKLGSTYLGLGFYRDSIISYNKVLNVYEKKGNVEDQAKGDLFLSLGEACVKEEKFCEGVQVLEKCLEIYKKINTKKSLISSAYQYLAEANCGMKQYKKSLDYLNSALDLLIEMEGLPDEVQALSSTYFVLGKVYLRKGSPEEALGYFKKCFSLQKGIPKSEKILGCLYLELGSTYAQLGNFEEAEHSLHQCLKIRKELYTDYKHIEISETYLSFALLRFLQNSYSAAFDFCKKSIQISSDVYSKSHPMLARAYKSLGLFYFSQGELTKSLENFREALEIRKDIYGESSIQAAEIYLDVSEIYMAMKEFKISHHNMKLALTLFKAWYGNHHNKIFECQLKLTRLYLLRGKRDKAKKMFKNSIEQLLTSLEVSFQDTLDSYPFKTLAEVYDTNKSELAKTVDSLGKQIGKIKDTYSELPEENKRIMVKKIGEVMWKLGRTKAEERQILNEIGLANKLLKSLTDL